ARPRFVVASQRAVPRGTNDALSPLEGKGIPLGRTWRLGSVGLSWSPHGIKTRGFLEGIDRETRAVNWLACWNNIAGWEGLPRWLVGLFGLALGAVACVYLAVIEHGAWALVLPPRSADKQTDCEDDLAPSEEQHAAEAITIRTPAGIRLAGRWIPASGPNS